MPKKYDIVAITGTYQKDGQDKARYKNVGVVIEKDGKFSIKLESLVTVHDDGHIVQWFQLFEPKPKSAPQPSAQPHHIPDGDFDDDIPF